MCPTLVCQPLLSTFNAQSTCLVIVLTQLYVGAWLAHALFKTYAQLATCKSHVKLGARDALYLS